MVIPAPDPDDPLKVRRVLAFMTAFFAMVLFPTIIAGMVAFCDLDLDFSLKLLLYEGGMATGPIGAYLFAAHKMQNQGK